MAAARRPMTGAPARNRDKASFGQIAALAGPGLRSVCEALHRLILSIHPDAELACWPKLRIASFGIGPSKASQHYAYLAVHNEHVNVGLYRGALLASHGLPVEGTGKHLRHVKIRNLAQLKHRGLRAILKDALRERMASARSPAVDAYIAAAPANVRPILESVRTTVRKAAPTAEERISYRMPAFFHRGALLYFAAFRNHIGLYPPVREKSLLPLVAKYAGPKGNLRLPLSEPIPHALIARIVKARLKSRGRGERDAGK